MCLGQSFSFQSSLWHAVIAGIPHSSREYTHCCEMTHHCNTQPTEQADCPWTQPIKSPHLPDMYNVMLSSQAVSSRMATVTCMVNIKCVNSQDCKLTRMADGTHQQLDCRLVCVQANTRKHGKCKWSTVGLCLITDESDVIAI